MPKKNHYLTVIFNRRMLAILLLGFSSGLPIALAVSTLQAWYTVAGINVVAIGALSLIGQPYVYKFLWAPFLDRFTLPFLSRRRGWILIMQFCLMVTLIIMAMLNPTHYPWLLAFAALGVAIFSATQDIAINAYTVDVLLTDERGMGASMTTAGYRVAMIVSGGVALILAAELGWQTMYLLMAFIMMILMIATALAPELKRVEIPQKLSKAIIEPFLNFFTRKNALIILVFVILYKLTDAFALSLNTTFLLRGVHFTLVEVGSIYKIVGLTAGLLGSFAGGFLMLSLRSFRSLLYFGILQGISNGMFVLLALVGHNYMMMVSSIAVESFCSGMGSVAILAFIMSLCDARYTATQFALLSAIAAIGRVFVGPFAGLIAEHFGWTQFYLFSIVLALPSLILLFYLRPIIGQEATASIDKVVEPA